MSKSVFIITNHAIITLPRILTVYRAAKVKIRSGNVIISNKAQYSSGPSSVSIPTEIDRTVTGRTQI